MNIQERPEWQQRVIKERDELAERLSKLNAFINNDSFEALLAEDQVLLAAQRSVMQELEVILTRRIKRFEQ